MNFFLIKRLQLASTFLIFVFISKINAQLPTISVASGKLHGSYNDSVFSFKGIPYAAPPLGQLRWKEPQPVKPWTGVREATSFGMRAMQQYIYTDMKFRSEGISEDCLYLNVWSPSIKGATLPVLVYFHGGGLSAGDGSEPRYDGASMAKKGIVMVTVNYRLGVFGFMAHPELTRESPHKSSGNYGLMDQLAALKWVKQNIKAFGGDPSKITIAGQSAGSRSVSAHMASPLSRGLFRSVIGESGSIITNLPTRTEAEAMGIKLATALDANSISTLRTMKAEDLMEKTSAVKDARFGAIIDGYFIPDSPIKIFATGLQADVPLLAGWTSAEVGYGNLMGKDELNATNYEKVLRDLYKDKADELLKLYPYASEQQLKQSATELASDRFNAYSTWKFMDLHAKTSGSGVYRYIFSKLLPSSDTIKKAIGAPHSADIEYALGNLLMSNNMKWTHEDENTSYVMQSYLVQFIKTGDPNGKGLPEWPTLQSSIPKVMVFDATPHTETERNLKRYVFLDQFYYK